MPRTLINVPKTAKAGEIVEVRAMIAHPMETGQRMGVNGAMIPRDIVNRFVCTYGSEVVFAADLWPAVSANPFLSFSLRAKEAGVITFSWTEDSGAVHVATADITVT
ncbi:thiosulfate oxidation carrier complex protein SoxZ [Azorhizobium oxalatiphilum]|uniref:Thiosulfate oxidation carrier complex protein SoxZ n=1 Tax=Azorhizobium oxalatiphilum TaxID=980631 RepID=A0A917FGI7_9HYPH|nr:thiosulfate oxidation carrier complex protein SoxZ [Azorhizobium oxalatiphilum]GGF73834.1 thiosulfate oxidation carrier complex protein SoxZ [Azorhizobium oxalatiphilum]